MAQGKGRAGIKEEKRIRIGTGIIQKKNERNKNQEHIKIGSKDDTRRGKGQYSIKTMEMEDKHMGEREEKKETRHARKKEDSERGDRERH